MVKKINNFVNSVVLCTYNEEEALPIVLSDLFKYIDGTYEVLVIDDGSDDKSVEIASNFPCRIISHGINQGKGAAIKTGVNNARGINIVFIDADNTYPVDCIPKITKGLTNYDMVVGSRYYGRENIPILNRFGNCFLRLLIRRIYGFKPYDPLTGLWGIKSHHIKKMFPLAQYAPDAEVAMKASLMKLKILDIPVVYRPRIGKTKLPPFKAGLEHLKLIISLKRNNEKDSKYYEQ